MPLSYGLETRRDPFLWILLSSLLDMCTQHQRYEDSTGQEDVIRAENA